VTPLPKALAARVSAFLEGDLQGDAPLDALAADLAAWLDGKPADALRLLLDDLRDGGGYGLSLRLLARAWEGTLSDAMAGEVAQDWIGTLLHGLGDRAAASDIARHVTPGALGRGAAFAGDLGDLLLSWDLRDEADPLVEFAARRNPGDLSAQFNYGVVLKFRGDWAACAAQFRALSVHRRDSAVLWNLGIACTALRDFAGARSAWRAVGLTVPDSDGDFARPGERVPVRLVAAPEAPILAEVVWGDRLCPCRVRLTGIPRFEPGAAFGDVVLVDGVSAGETTLNGQTVPIVSALGVFQSAGGALFRLRAPVGRALAPESMARVAQALRVAGYAATDWRGVGQATPAVGVVLAADQAAHDLAAAVTEAIAGLPLFCPELDAAAGRPPGATLETLPRY
jgi:hypothetical protein